MPVTESPDFNFEASIKDALREALRELSAWVLHPQNNDTRRQTIESIIQSALKKQPVNLNRKAS